MIERNTLFVGDVLDFAAHLAPGSVHCLVTSPPYWALRDYGQPGQLGLERTVEAYVTALVAVFDALRPALRHDGTLWLNLGDSYANERSWGGKSGKKNATSDAGGYPRHKVSPGLGNKQLCGVPWRVAFALQAAGWCLRSDIIWSKPNPMPESVTDRPTKSHEYVFLLSKGSRYFFDQEAVKEPVTGNTHSRGTKKSPPKSLQHDDSSAKVKNNRSFMEAVWGPVEARNIRSVWTLPTVPFPGSHFATFPPELARRCIRAGTSAYGVCANPACGAPWRRVVESSNPSKAANEGEDLSGGAFVGRTANPQTSKGLHRNGGGVYSSRQVLGWEPICTCNADVVPAVVADPFAGSGTTCQVAAEEGRDWVACDLDPRARGWLAGRLAKVQRRLPLDVCAD